MSFGSYSGMSAPIDITPTYFASRTQDASCAFPSWPRRASLSLNDPDEHRATSFLSDEDLFPSDPFEDDARSVSSTGSNSPVTSPRELMHHPHDPVMTDADILEMERERAAYQKEVMRFILNEKERRRQQAMMRNKLMRRSSGSGSSSNGHSAATSSSAKKSPKSKLSAMTPIAEAGAE